MTQDLSWLNEIRQLTAELPRQFEPGAPETDMWLERAKIWLEALTDHWKLSDCDRDEKVKELLSVKEKEYETEKQVLPGTMILQSLGALGGILDTVNTNRPNMVEKLTNLTCLKGWTEVASGLV